MAKQIEMENMIGYSANQEGPYLLAKKIFKNRIDREILNEYKNIVLKYYPNDTDSEILHFFEKLKNEGCSYASVANIIAQYLNYDDTFFVENFGFHLYERNGTINFDKLMLDLYTCLSKFVKVDISTYGWMKGKTTSEVGKKILNQGFENDRETLVALFDAGWLADGKDDDGNVIFKSKECVNQSFVGSYSDIAFELFGVEYENLSKQDFMSLINQNKVNCRIEYEDAPSKLGGLFKDQTYNFWINQYFQKKNINLLMNATLINKEWQNYNQFMTDIIDRIGNGSLINVSVGPNSPVMMTNGKRFGYTNISNSKVGHQMTFSGFDQNGDIIVASYGEIFMIHKEYYKQLDYLDARMHGYKKELEGKANKVT